jgi:putative endonuclease
MFVLRHICGGSVLLVSAEERRRGVLGRLGERLAAEHLEARGFSLLARNYRTHRGEVDLIAFDGTTLIFVQVKTHQVDSPGARLKPSLLEWFSDTQMARYRWVAEAWLQDDRHTGPEAQSVRFDAIGVLVDAQGELMALEHVEGGWVAGKYSRATCAIR